jgi:hypothetical protein
MKLAIAAVLIAPVASFLPVAHHAKPAVVLKGYLDSLGGALPPEEEVQEDDSYEATKLDKSKVSNYGVADWSSFVDFNEFDGGDGQMGVAGDGNSKLEKFDMSSMAKSKTMSAKNAWGKSTGYADVLVAQGMEQQKAQQLENWKNQQEVRLTAKNTAGVPGTFFHCCTLCSSCCFLLHIFLRSFLDRFKLPEKSML